MAGLRVLVVDKDPDFVAGLRTALEGEGFAVQAAGSGADGLESANAEVPDLVICEIELPDMSGWNFIRQLRAGPQFAFVPVVFLSSVADETVRIRGFRLGADDVLAKPIDFADVALRVARVLADGYRIEHSVRSQSTDAATEDGTGMRGTLEDVGLSTLLSIFEVERAGGVLTVTNGETGQTGRIYLRGGRAVRSRIQGVADPVNREAIYDMLRWGRGHFNFKSAYIAGDNEVDASSMHLLIEGARRLDDETRRIQLHEAGAEEAEAAGDELPVASAEEAERLLDEHRDAEGSGDAEGVEGADGAEGAEGVEGAEG